MEEYDELDAVNNDALADDTDDNIHELSKKREDFEAVLWSTDWTTETISSQINKGNINLDPDFQRRSAWNRKQQSRLIESLILGLPVPSIILAETKGQRGKYLVIDGKQRLTAIKNFSSSSSDNANFSPLKLTGLEVLGDLNNKTFDDIKDSDDCRSYENSTVRTIIIRGWKNDDFIYQIFLRINTGSVKLSPQELRQALYPGEFSKYVQEASGDSTGIKEALNLNRPDPRMRDAEMLLRFLAYKNYSKTFEGGLKNFLDTATKKLNKEWGDKKSKIVGQTAQMEEAFSFTKAIFGEDDYLREWNKNEGKYERRKNKAIIDIMLQFFSEPKLREALKDKKQQIQNEFKALSETTEFYEALRSTTHSLSSNQTRFNRWGDILSRISGQNLDHLLIPEGE